MDKIKLLANQYFEKTLGAYYHPRNLFALEHPSSTNLTFLNVYELS